MKHTMLALALVAGAALAQSQPSSVTGTPGMGTAPPSATGTPGTTPIATPATPATSSGTMGTSQHLPARSDTADNAYRTLDTHRRGYLTREDVQSIRGFSFEAADTNKDGRLTQQEFARAWSSQSASSPWKN